MKKILPEFVFSDEQLDIVRRLAKECNLCEETVKILYGRGLRDKSAIEGFMYPSKERFISPFKMSGMREAVDLITRARDEGWAVVVYGDYDADGICASTIMGNALKDFGIEPVLCVPERTNGYGLSELLINQIFDEYFPQLFITVDCGISCAEEVEYIKEMGAEVIVTDHHELPEEIPDCICINPKFKDDYIYDNLCGAGVAFKVACALNGESAYKYLDFAAIATVADSVPLTGENRDIVFEGLKLINRNPSACYSQFLNKTDAVTSQTLAFSVAPKINAAGRMGDAKAALTLFNESDENKIFDLSAKLTAYNLERQKCCDELYSSAKQMLGEQGGAGRIILLCNESWNSGFVGIVAARLADEFSCPAILFVKNGDMLKGSARSVENVNIFEALRACSEHIAEFGGHSQAAGVNVRVEDFENLSEALHSYMSQNYSKEDFTPSVYINGNLAGAYSQKFVKELEMLEPFGVGNRRPMFEADCGALPVRVVKPQSPHISVKTEYLELMYFGGAKYAGLIASGAKKKLIFEYNVSSFRGKEYVKGFIRDVVYDPATICGAEEDIAFAGIESLANPAVDCTVSEVSRAEAERLLSEESYGALFIAADDNTAVSFSAGINVDKELFTPTSKNCSSLILIAPSDDADLSGYTRVIFLNAIYGGVRNKSLAGKTVEVCVGAPVAGYIKKLSCDRQDLLSLFSEVASSACEGATAAEVAKSIKTGNAVQMFFALKVFEQLGLISFANGRLEVRKGVKSKLENSSLYNIVKEMQAE